MNKRSLVPIAFAFALLVSALPTVALAAAPANDNIGNAVVIGNLPFTDARDTTEATSVSTDPYSFCYVGRQIRTVWYSFTPTSGMRLEASTLGSSYDTILSVYDGSPGALFHVACNDDSGDPPALQSQVRFTATAGRTYYFMIGSYADTADGNLNFNVVSVPGPANDDFDNAIAITTLPFIDVRDTSAATRATDDPSVCIYSQATVWYSFTPTTNMRVEASTSGSDYYTTVAVLTGSRGALSSVGCAFSSYSPIRFDAIAGQTYHLMVGGLSGAGNLSFTVTELPAPANDDFDNALVINSLPFNDTRNIAGATAAPDDPNSCFFSARSTVWYSFTPTSDMRLELDNAGSAYAPTIGVFVGTRGALSPITCAYSFPARFDAQSGQTYYFMVNGSAYGGYLDFTLRAAPPRLAIDISVNTFGSVVPTTGVATISGTVTCNQPSYIDLSGDVQQKVGRGRISGYIYTGMYCDGITPSTWSATVYSQPGAPIGGGRAATLFTAGKVTTNLYANGYSQYGNEYAHDSSTGTITLRGAH